MRIVLDWLKKSNRWKHLTGGILLGMASDSWWCATLVGVSTGGAMEMKDVLYGQKADGVDWALTAAGALTGYAITGVAVKSLVTWLILR